MKFNNLEKSHISFSELKQWRECSWRHKLIYIDKLQTFEESPHLHYGTILHDACELYLKEKVIDLGGVENKIKLVWDEYGFDSEDFIKLPAFYLPSSGKIAISRSLFSYNHKVSKKCGYQKSYLSN